MPRELASDVLCTLPCTHAQRSRRFSAQTCSQHNQILSRIQVRGGAAGRGRMSHINSAAYCRSLHLVNSTLVSALITKDRLDILIGGYFYVCDFTFSHRDIYFVVVFFHFCICPMLEASTLPTPSRWIQRSLSCCVLTSTPPDFRQILY